jgi:hypothetical protein
MTPRGIRNNNPGNINRDGIEWQGMAADQSSDPRFVVFTDPVWGIRAIAKILINYGQHGVSTVRTAIMRWAPPTENDSTAYVQAVARALMVAPDAKIDLHDKATLISFVQAIIRHENGSQPYPLATIVDGVQRALGAPGDA